MQKIWNVKKYDEDKLKEITDKFNVSKLMAKLLIAREIPFDQIDSFLNAKISDLIDPFLLKDMDKFVLRVKMAIDSKEKICIYGDYDVDGITSITVMHKFLSSLGACVDFYLPDRLVEGYGINIKALDEIKKRGNTLVITVDCGITAVDEIKYAKKIGLDVCITDHHECSDELPVGVPIINPKQKDDNYPFKMLAGVGVAFKCITALSIEYGLDKESYLKHLDIVAIGTISDIVALVDENRIISKYGLEQIENTNNIGLKALLKIINYKEIDSTMVSFAMAPRINACGRMGKASVAVELLLESDETKVEMFAKKLDELNVSRQTVEKKIFDEAIDTIKNMKLENKNSIILYNENWHNGVVGIVASRLVNMYFKPVILLTKENNVIRGSGRCQIGFSLYDALTKCKDLLVQFGGHELAAGLSINEENIEEFKQKFDKVASEISSNLNEQIISIDSEIKRENLTIQTIKDIKSLKPYGQANKTPLFLYKNLKIQSIRTIKEEKHLKFTLQDERSLIEGVAFSQGERRDEFLLGDKIDVVCHVELNTYNNPKTIQLVIQDFKKSI